MSNDIIGILKNKVNDIAPIFMIIILYGIIHFFNIGITGAIIGIIFIYFVQAMLLKKYPPKDISNWAGQKTNESEKIKQYAIEFLNNSMKKISLIILCLMPILYYFEFGMGESIRINGTLYLNRLLCIPIIVGVIILMGYPFICVEKEINKRFK